MTTRTRLNIYFDPALIPQIEAMALRRSVALRRNVSKSAIVEAAVMSYLSGDADDQLEAAMSRRLDKLGRQIDTLDEDLDARWLAGEAVFEHTKLSAEAKIGYDLVLGELVNDLKSGRLDEAERVAKRLDPDARRKERNRRKRQNKK